MGPASRPSEIHHAGRSRTEVGVACAVTPQSDAFPVPRTVSLTKAYAPKEIALYEKYFARKVRLTYREGLGKGYILTLEEWAAIAG